jgi:ferrous iron transport protein B
MIWGFFSLQAAVLAGLYVIAALVGLFIALLMKKTIFKGDITPFLIEFPPYRMPSLKSLLVTVYDRSKDFLTSAGTVIVTLSIILWFLSAFPRIDFLYSQTANAIRTIVCWFIRKSYRAYLYSTWF